MLLCFFIAIATRPLRQEQRIIIKVVDHTIDLLEFILVLFLALGMLVWLIFLNLMESTHLAWYVVIFSFVTGMIVAGELVEVNEFIRTLNLLTEIKGMLVFSDLVVRHLYMTLRGRKYIGWNMWLVIYLSSYIIIVFGGICSITAEALPSSAIRDILAKLWLVGFSIGLMIMNVIYVMYPGSFIVTQSEPYLLVIMDHGGTALFE